MTTNQAKKFTLDRLAKYRSVNGAVEWKDITTQWNHAGMLITTRSAENGLIMQFNTFVEQQISEEAVAELRRAVGLPNDREDALELASFTCT